jgi:hypothetical protein
MLPPQNPGNVEAPRKMPPSFPCPSCPAAFGCTVTWLDPYTKNVTCPACGNHFSSWELILHSIKGPSPFFCFSPLGAKNTLFRTKVYLSSENRFNLYDNGLPKGAIILDLYLISSGMFCTEMGGNRRRQRPRGGNLQLFGFHTYTSPDPSVTEATVDISVTWVPSADHDIAWKSLVLAFDEFADEDFDQSVIPANVAVESKVLRFLDPRISSIASKNRCKDLLDVATYSHQLNTLLPMITSAKGIQPMDESIRGNLNALRNQRNQLAHNGYSEPPLSKDRMADLLASVLFGFAYLDYLERNF